MGWSSTSEVTMIGTLLTLDGQLFSGIFSLVTCYLSHSGIFLFAGQSLWGEGRGAARCASVSTQYTSAEVHSPISCTTSILASSWNIEQKGSNVKNVGWPHSSAWTLNSPSAVSSLCRLCRECRAGWLQIQEDSNILQNNQPSPNMTKLYILSKGTIHSDHQVLQKSYLGKKWTDVFLFSSRTSTLASWTLSWPFWSLFTGTGDFKKGFKFLKTKYRQTKMRRHVVLAMDVSVFLLKTIGKP